MKVRIEITKGPDNGRVFYLEGREKLIIGRGDDVQIRMKDGLISREHCEVIFDGKQLFIRDLGSTNRTFVQENLHEPITPRQKYSIADRTSFFVGPESRFSVSYDHSQQSKPVSPVGSTERGNFTQSIEPKGPSFDRGGDSAEFNLLGHVASAPGLGDAGRPRQPLPPTVRPPKQPTSDSNSPSPDGYDMSSIVPPHLQGRDEDARDQVVEEPNVDESHLKTVSNVEDSSVNLDQHRPAPGQQSAPPSSFDESSISEGAPSHLESIASPGRNYPGRAPQPTKVESSNPFEASVIPEKREISHSSESVGLPSEPPTESSSNVQSNGLYFHTGTDAKLVPQLISELGEKLTAVFCFDPTHVDQAAPLQTLPANEIPAELPAAIESKPATENVATTNTSAFDLDDDDEPLTQSANQEVQQELVAIKGIPLFELLPKNLQQMGPSLMTNDQFDASIEEIWNQDALVVFFGTDIEQMVSHLKQLVHVDIQSGKTLKGMFGFCWPSILHATLESQSQVAVSRIFGDCISCILLEDPQERFQWNLVAQRDLNPEFALLKKS